MIECQQKGEAVSILKVSLKNIFKNSADKVLLLEGKVIFYEPMYKKGLSFLFAMEK